MFAIFDGMLELTPFSRLRNQSELPSYFCTQSKCLNKYENQ
jgi:hypothetical protein